MTYTNIPNSDVDPGSPLSTALMTALRDNTEAQIGRGQTWQNVLGSRAFNTTYQNTTDKPIEVFFDVDAVSGVGRGVFVSDDNVTFVTLTDFRNGNDRWMSFVVPVNHYYRLAFGTSGTLSFWSELR